MPPHGPLSQLKWSHSSCNWFLILTKALDHISNQKRKMIWLWLDLLVFPASLSIFDRLLRLPVEVSIKEIDSLLMKMKSRKDIMFKPQEEVENHYCLLIWRENMRIRIRMFGSFQLLSSVGQGKVEEQWGLLIFGFQRLRVFPPFSPRWFYALWCFVWYWFLLFSNHSPIFYGSDVWFLLGWLVSSLPFGLLCMLYVEIIF